MNAQGHGSVDPSGVHGRPAAGLAALVGHWLERQRLGLDDRHRRVQWQRELEHKVQEHLASQRSARREPGVAGRWRR